MTFKERLKAKLIELRDIKEQTSHLNEEAYNSGRWKGLTAAINLIDSMPEEPASEDLDFQTFAKEMDNVFNLPSDVTENTEEPLNWEYAIAHLLRELGFRKESAWYIVKAKGMKPVKFKLNRNNHWHIEHHDFNGDSKFYPRMALQWKLPWGEIGTPYYQPFDHEGNIYTVPSLDQIHEFCCRRGFACYSIHEPQEIIRHLVFMYRKLNNDQTAFRKYVERK